MSERNQELELYKLITKEEYECGWVNDSQFFVWVSYYQFKEFMGRIQEIFGNWMFDDEGFEVTVLQDCICIPLSEILDDGETDFERVFAKEEFKH